MESKFNVTVVQFDLLVHMQNTIFVYFDSILKKNYCMQVSSTIIGLLNQVNVDNLKLLRLSVTGIRKKRQANNDLILNQYFTEDF
jgi:hypothetical protein